MQFQQSVSRIQPVGEVHQYQTYSIKAGKDTGVISACQDVGCQNWAHGWETAVDETSELGRSQAAYIRRSSGRTFTERTTGAGLTVFRFEAFQRCFAEHRTRADVLTRRHGDWRGNPTGQVFQHLTVADWVEDFAEHQDRLHHEIQKG